MGYLQQGKKAAYFIRLTDETTKELFRLHSIGKRTKSKRIRKKISKRIDALVPVGPVSWMPRVKPHTGKMTGSPTATDWAAPIGTPIPKVGGRVVRLNG